MRPTRPRARGGELGLLHGVPMAHKDMFYRTGQLAECGALLARGHRPTVTATVLRRLDAAGAIDVGRLNMVEFALGITGHNAHTGHPQNPWDRSRITGGSTSGGAAAVAARLIPATLGSDTGGSIRYPGRAVRPVRAQADLRPGQPLWLHAAVVLARPYRPAGALARRPGADAAGDRRARPRRSDHERAAGARLPGRAAAVALRGLRLAVAAEDPTRRSTARLPRLIERAAGVLAEAGMSARPVTLPSFEQLNALRRVVMLVRVRGVPPRAGRATGAGLQPADRGAPGPGLRRSRA